MAREIVDPEPHSPRNLRVGWEYIPRRARLILWAIAVAAVILFAFFTR
jgi:hypothetical protein